MQVKYKNKALFDKIQDKNKKYFGIVGLGVGNYKITTERGDVSIGTGSASFFRHRLAVSADGINILD